MNRRARAAAVLAAAAVGLSGCGFSPYDLPLPGGANLGDDPYEVTVEFRDVLDLVPQSAVRIDDLAVGKVTSIELDGWTATATLSINRDAELPDNAEATIRQSSLLGEKFVSLAPPEQGGTGTLGDGDSIGLDRSGRNPDIEEVLGAASLLLNGGGLERTNTIVKELNLALDGNEPEVKELLQTSEAFIGQLDDNKESLITALEKVNNLAVATNEQRGSIESALDDLPEALAVLEDQRGELVGLLEALDGLGDVATGVIRRSKDDTLAVLRDLEPTLRELANAGDDLAGATEVLLSFPFTDAIVGDNPNRVQTASIACGQNASASDPDLVKDAACYGDYANLDINLDLNVEQLLDLVTGLLGADLTGSSGASESGGGTSGQESDDERAELTDLVEGLTMPEEPNGESSGGDGGSGERSGGDGGSAEDEGSDGGADRGGICSLLGCRTSPAQLMESQDDIGRLVLGPVVAR